MEVLISTMAGTSEIDVKCVKCKHEYQAHVIEHVDLSEDTDIIKKLRRGKANRVQCPKCKKVQYLQRSIVINFEPQSLIVIYDPNAKSKSAHDSLVREYQSIINYNETLSEIGEETEFKVISDLKNLKPLLKEYASLYT
jgi:ribosomal protein S27E